MSDCGKYPYEGPIMNEANWFTNETTKLLAENLAQRSKLDELERENAKLRELATRMAAEMREVDHEFASLQDYDAARKEAQP